MNDVIFKYGLEKIDEQTITLPEHHEILTVQTQNEQPVMWVKVDNQSGLTVDVKIITHGTGHEVSEKAGKYLGTYQLSDGMLVFHVFLAK